MMSSITANIVSPTARQPYSVVIGMMIQPQPKITLDNPGQQLLKISKASKKKLKMNYVEKILSPELEQDTINYNNC